MSNCRQGLHDGDRLTFVRVGFAMSRCAVVSADALTDRAAFMIAGDHLVTRGQVRRSLRPGWHFRGNSASNRSAVWREFRWMRVKHQTATTNNVYTVS